MSELLMKAREDTNEACSWLGQAIEAYREELALRDGHDTGKYGGEIQKSISELQFILSRIRRLHKESRLLNREIVEYQKEQDRLSVSDGVTVTAQQHEAKETDLWRCTVCGRVGTVGRCCGEETRERANMEQLLAETCEEALRWMLANDGPQTLVKLVRVREI